MSATTASRRRSTSRACCVQRGAIVSYSDPHVPEVDEHGFEMRATPEEVALDARHRLRRDRDRSSRLRLRSAAAARAARRRYAERLEGAIGRSHLPTLTDLKPAPLSRRAEHTHEVERQGPDRRRGARGHCRRLVPVQPQERAGQSDRSRRAVPAGRTPLEQHAEGGRVRSRPDGHRRAGEAQHPRQAVRAASPTR